MNRDLKNLKDLDLILSIFLALFLITIALGTGFLLA